MSNKISLEEYFTIPNFIIILLSLILAYQQYKISQIQTDLIGQQNSISTVSNTLQSQSNELQEQNNQINRIMADTSKSQAKIADKSLEFMKNQTYFQTKEALNQSLENTKYDLIKMKLDKNERIIVIEGLKDYLNNFEEVYMACHRGIVPRIDIDTSYKYLLGDICANKDAVRATESGHGGLKKLCGLFFPKSPMAELARMQSNNCK